MIIACKSLSHSFGARTLFDDLSLVIHHGERIGVIGANGSGKTTLLKIVAGMESPDGGERHVARDARIGYVPQEPVFPDGSTVASVIGAAYDQLPSRADDEPSQREVQVSMTANRVGFSEIDQKASTLSGGWLKRLALAAALVGEPDLLLMDEPTNHLDLAGISWLENFLLSSKIALLVVTHDRAFLQTVADRIIEIDRKHQGGSLQIEGNYSSFLEKREAGLQARKSATDALASKVRREVEWLKRGPKARTGKSKQRQAQASALISELEELKLKAKSSQAEIEFSDTGRRTKRLLVANSLAAERGGKRLFNDLDLLLKPGLRIGIVGDNGSGKSTLIKLLAGELEPTEGEISRVQGLKTVLFDQHREIIDPTKTLRKTLAPHGDHLVAGGREVHVVSWARRFLFRTEQLDMTVGQLSGGEQAKLAIALLMQRSADILLLDEPTNDLDIPTLEVLEESLQEFGGALVMVTHDRYLLDRVCSVIIGLEKGRAGIYADLTQWEAERKELRRQHILETRKIDSVRSEKPKRVSLTYLEKKEYEAMESMILEAEDKLEKARKITEDPDISSDADKLNAAYQAFTELQTEVEQLYARWSELDEKTK